MVSFRFPSPEFFSSSVSLVISGSVILSNKNTDEQRGTGDFLSFFFAAMWNYGLSMLLYTFLWEFGTSRVNLVQSFCCSVSQNGQQLLCVFYAIYKLHTVNTKPAKNAFFFSFFCRWCSCRLLALMSSAAPSNGAAVGGDHFVVFFCSFFSVRVMTSGWIGSATKHKAAEWV